MQFSHGKALCGNSVSYMKGDVYLPWTLKNRPSRVASETSDFCVDPSIGANDTALGVELMQPTRNETNRKTDLALVLTKCP